MNPNRSDPQDPQYLTKATEWMIALLRRKNGAEVKYLLSHEQENEFYAMRCSVRRTSEQTLVCIVHDALLNCAQHPLPQTWDAIATDYTHFYMQYFRSGGGIERDESLLDIAHLRWATGPGIERGVVRMVTNSTTVTGHSQ